MQNETQAEDFCREDMLNHWSLRIQHASAMQKLGFELAATTLVTAAVLSSPTAST